MKKYGLLLVLMLSASGCATTGGFSKSQVIAEPRAVEEVVAAQPVRGVISAGTIQPIQSLTEVKSLLSNLPPGKILVVFDIDDTLLTANKPAFFGSDLWYMWQKEGAHGGTVVPCRSDVLALNYMAGTQKGTEPSIGPEVVSGIAHDKMILTSRAPAYRSATERELAKALYPVLSNIAGPKGGMAFTWTDARKETDRNFVTYANGIFMTEGGHKGRMLWHLLGLLGMEHTYDAIVLVDDTRTKQEDMRDELANKGVAFYGLHYIKVKNDADPLKKLEPSPQQKAEAEESWKSMKKYLNSDYPGFADRCFTKQFAM